MADKTEEQTAPPPTEAQVTAAKQAIGKYGDFLGEVLARVFTKYQQAPGDPEKSRWRHRLEGLKAMSDDLSHIAFPDMQLSGDYGQHMQDGITYLRALRESMRDFNDIAGFGKKIDELVGLVATAGGITLSREGRPR